LDTAGEEESMSIRSVHDPAVVPKVEAPAEPSASRKPRDGECAAFRSLLEGAVFPGSAAPASVNAVLPEILPHLVRMQMTESWLRMMEGEEGVAGDHAGRINVLLTAPPSREEPDASKIRHNSRENGDPGGGALSAVIEEAARTCGVDADLVRSIIEVESGFRPDSLSAKGAMGLMQLMPDTARELGVGDPYDPRQNIMGGTRYLRRLIDRYGGDVATALSAYNWGMGNVDRRPGDMPAETVAYVERVSRRYRELKA